MTTWGDHKWETDPELPPDWAECAVCGDCNNSLYECCIPRRKCPGYMDHAKRPFSRTKTLALRIKWRLGR